MEFFLWSMGRLKGQIEFEESKELSDNWRLEGSHSM